LADPVPQWCRPPLEALYLTGPTASGKTPLALDIAQRIGAEILSLDSMAVYQGMDIGTAKPSAADRAVVPHHLIDLVPPTESYSVSCFVDAAHATAAEIRARGNRVLCVGGTPLYLKSLLRGLFQGPPADEDFRKAVEEDVAAHGTQQLRERLAQVDPLLAHKLHPNDARRMIRALEVARATGLPLSHWQTQFEAPARGVRIRAAVLGLDRAWLHARINRRSSEMLASGLEQEVRGLLTQYGRLGATASQAVGYRETLAFLAGEIDAAGLLAEIQAHTRQFARRQEIWFRGLSELHRFPLTADTDTASLAAEIADWFMSDTSSG
jgi:tRNA dimethylallyltransferase